MNVILPVPVDRWADALQRTIDGSGGMFKRVVVLEETDSTQDAARRMDAQIGDVILAGRQTAGHGRLGRAWADTGEDGIAMTVVMKPERPERMATIAAVEVAGAIEIAQKVTPCPKRQPIGIKWPNDIMAGARKVAGVLIEVVDGRALVGIGINVSQTAWPPELEGRAVSLGQLGMAIERIALTDFVLQGLLGWSTDSDERIAERFGELDVLRGSVSTFRCGDRQIIGTVLRVDPMRGLAVQTDDGEVWLPAATTTVLDWHFPVHSD